MKEFQPDLNPQKLSEIETIIPGIRPPLPLESKELYKAIRPADVSSNISEELRKSPRLRKFFKSFAGQVVVDIGPGNALSGYDIALFSKAKAYVGVEPYEFIRNLEQMLAVADKMLVTPSPQIPRTAIQADALSFFRRLPDKSVSIFASQLESVMVQRYSDDLVQEIERVLHPKGVFIEYDSHLHLDRSLFTHEIFDREKMSEGFINLPFELEKYQPKV